SLWRRGAPSRRTNNIPSTRSRPAQRSAASASRTRPGVPEHGRKERPMSTSERIPVYLERYAAEVTQWRREAIAARALHATPQPQSVHPKDRTLLSHIDSILSQRDHTHRLPSYRHSLEGI